MLSHEGEPRAAEYVETPERVALEVDLAGVGSRALACLLDTLLIGAVLFSLLVLISVLPVLPGNLGVIIFLITAFALHWFYFAAFEALRGQTPGKRALGLRVHRVGGYAIGWSEALIRNFLRIVDGFLAYAVGVCVMLVTARHQRLGDLAAGTVVVREAKVEGWGLHPGEALLLREPAISGLPGVVLSAEEYDLLDEFLMRRMALHDESSARILQRLAARMRGRLEAQGAMRSSWRQMHDEAFLVELERSLRAGRPKRS